MASKKVEENIKKLRAQIFNGELPHGQLLPPEKQLAENLQLSRPTVAKIYDALREEGLIQKKAGYGTFVVYKKEEKKYTFGLLFPGARESEIFGEISDYFLNIEKGNNVKFLWDGVVANDATIRQNTILEICKSYLENGVNGVFFAPLERVENVGELNKKVCELFEKQKIPIILMDRDISRFPHRSKYRVIGLDNFMAGYTMTDHLIQNGCERIFFLCREESASSVYKRIVGCSSACFDAGIPFNRENLIIGDPSNIETLKRIDILPAKTGILCANDATAALLMANIYQLNVKVAKEVLIAGYDNMKYSKLLQVPLTTYEQPLSNIATVSYQMMLEQMDENIEDVALNIEIEGRIIVRDSTKFS